MSRSGLTASLSSRLQYASAYRQVRQAITLRAGARERPGAGGRFRAVERDRPRIPATCEATGFAISWTYLEALGDDEVDGFAIHTYTHDLNPQQIRGDYFHTQPGYPPAQRVSHLSRLHERHSGSVPPSAGADHGDGPDDTTSGLESRRKRGLGAGCLSRDRRMERNPEHQPIQALILYRWPVVPDQPEWSISDRPGIIEDFKMALRAKPREAYLVRQPNDPAPLDVVEPGNYCRRRPVARFRRRVARAEFAHGSKHCTMPSFRFCPLARW